MTLLHEAVESKKQDVRVVQRNIDRGLIKVDDVDKTVKSLPDDSANAEWSNTDELAKQD